MKNIIEFFKGYLRSFAFTVKFPLRKHIQEQVVWRIKAAKVECIQNGECIRCGCSTPELQLSDKECVECYPRMMNKKEWNYFKESGSIKLDSKIWIY